jgi:hypothetical protein
LREALQDGQRERGGLAAPGLRKPDDVSPCQDQSGVNKKNEIWSALTRGAQIRFYLLILPE